MPIDLPPVPLTAEVSPRLISFGADLTPPLGGPMQRIRRLGSRFAVQVTLPSLDAVTGAQWIAAQLAAEAEGDTLRMSWAQAALGLAPGLAVAITLAGQLGTQIAVSGVTSLVPAGAFFSFKGADGHTYLHTVTRAAAAGAGGFFIAPMLRSSPPAGAALNFANPVVEGYADASGLAWKHQLKRWTSLTVNLTENR